MIDRGARRRRAKHLMDGVTVICVTVAIAIGTGQLVKEGLQEFLNRPPGVGASPSEADAESPVVAQSIPSPAPPPSPTPVESSRRHHHGPDVR